MTYRIGLLSTTTASRNGQNDTQVRGNSFGIGSFHLLAKPARLRAPSKDKRRDGVSGNSPVSIPMNFPHHKAHNPAKAGSRVPNLWLVRPWRKIPSPQPNSQGLTYS